MSDFINIDEHNKDEYNRVVSHPLQSYEWGEFRKKTGVTIVRRGIVKDKKLVGGFTLTIHRIPKLPYTIGYLPKGDLPTPEIIEELKKIGKEYKCIFIQLEPNIEVENGTFNSQLSILNLRPSFHPLFTRYTFILDLTKSEEELLKEMHSKTRYNIRVAEKHGVEIVEDNSDKAFKRYLELTRETTTRQKFFAHTPQYHKTMWETLNVENGKLKMENYNSLTAHLLVAKYNPVQDKFSTLNSQLSILTAWILFVFKDTLYYPYGASSSEHRNVMASNLIMWEAIKFGKNLGLKKFDMWGALGPEPDENDPWYGFHKFKQGYGANLVEFVGSYDLIINPLLYQLYKVGDKARWMMLRIKK